MVLFDKYARMISKWLSKLDLLVQLAKEIEITIGGEEYKEKIGQSYIITVKGVEHSIRLIVEVNIKE